MNDLCLFEINYGKVLCYLVWPDTRVPVAPGTPVNGLVTEAGRSGRNWTVWVHSDLEHEELKNE